MTPEKTSHDEYVTKLTIASLGCKPALVKDLPEEKKQLPVARIYGKVQDTRHQDDKAKGEVYTYFTGMFEGINLQDGTVLRSAKLFLPRGISEVVETAVQNLRTKEEPGEAVTFAFEIRAIKAGNPSGYSYVAHAIKKAEAEDELAELRNLVTEKTKQHAKAS